MPYDTVKNQDVPPGFDCDRARLIDVLKDTLSPEAVATIAANLLTPGTLPIHDATKVATEKNWFIGSLIHALGGEDAFSKMRNDLVF